MGMKNKAWKCNKCGWQSPPNMSEDWYHNPTCLNCHEHEGTEVDAPETARTLGMALGRIELCQNRDVRSYSTESILLRTLSRKLELVGEDIIKLALGRFVRFWYRPTSEPAFEISFGVFCDLYRLVKQGEADGKIPDMIRIAVPGEIVSAGSSGPEFKYHSAPATIPDAFTGSQSTPAEIADHLATSAPEDIAQLEAYHRGWNMIDGGDGSSFEGLLIRVPIASLCNLLVAKGILTIGEIVEARKGVLSREIAGIQKALEREMGVEIDLLNPPEAEADEGGDT